MELFVDNNINFEINKELLIQRNKQECVKYLINKGYKFHIPNNINNATTDYLKSRNENFDIDLYVRLGYGTMEYKIPTLNDLVVLVNKLTDRNKQLYLDKLIIRLPTLFTLLIDKLNIKNTGHYLDKAIEHKRLNIVKYFVEKGISKKVESFSLNNKCINYLKLENDIFSDYFVFVLENFGNKDLIIDREYLNDKQIKFIKDYKMAG